MACGGCGKRRASANRVTIRRANTGKCPTCGSVIRYVHRLDRGTGRMRRSTTCSNPRCTFKKR